MSEQARQQALDAVQHAHRHLLTAWKHLMGRKIPLAGFEFRIQDALKELDEVQGRVLQALQALEEHRPPRG